MSWVLWWAKSTLSTTNWLALSFLRSVTFSMFYCWSIGVKTSLNRKIVNIDILHHIFSENRSTKFAGKADPKFSQNCQKFYRAWRRIGNNNFRLEIYKSIKNCQKSSLLKHVQFKNKASAMVIKNWCKFKDIYFEFLKGHSKIEISTSTAGWVLQPL